MSTDNKAYKPSASDVDEDEEFLDDEKGKRRKKKKRKEPVGVVNTLPSLTYDKRKKRKGKESKGNVAGVEESEGEGSESDDQATDKVMCTSALLFLSFSLYSSRLAVHASGSIDTSEFNPPIFATLSSAPVRPPWVYSARPTAQ